MWALEIKPKSPSVYHKNLYLLSPSLPPESFSLIWVFSCAFASKISLCALKVLISDRFTDVVENVLSFFLVFSVTYFLSIWVSQALPTVDFWFKSTVFREF